MWSVGFKEKALRRQSQRLIDMHGKGKGILKPKGPSMAMAKGTLKAKTLLTIIRVYAEGRCSGLKRWSSF
jgi:hypothetical protein